MTELTFTQWLLAAPFIILFYLFVVLIPLAFAFRAAATLLAIFAETVIPLLFFPVDCLLRIFSSRYRARAESAPAVRLPAHRS